MRPLNFHKGLLSGIFLLSAVGVLAVSGCQKIPESPPSNVSPNLDNAAERLGMQFFTDKETGCQYVLYYTHGISPRFANDGRTVRGCKYSGYSE